MSALDKMEPRSAYYYSKVVIKARSLDLEHVIAKDDKVAWGYCRDVTGRLEKFDKQIKNSNELTKDMKEEYLEDFPGVERELNVT